MAIVEGHGETTAFPALVRKIFREQYPHVALDMPTPIRVSRSKFVADGSEQDRTLRLAAQKAGEDGFLLLLLDADDDCPVELSAQLRVELRSHRSDLAVSIVLAKREFESWFLPAAAALGICAAEEVPADCEAIAGAKEWIKARRGRYSPTVDQTSFAARLPLEAASRSPSFRKLLRELDRIVAQLSEPTP
ncbi:MAG: DUF4276 family protein [Bryobacter sp.]|nr:DUF4276 family protein [Bryobacter sp.]